MKFGKYLAYQAFQQPEFKDLFLRYNVLKADIKPLAAIHKDTHSKEQAVTVFDDCIRSFLIHLEQDCEAIIRFLAAEHMLLSSQIKEMQVERQGYNRCLPIYRRCEELKSFMTLNRVAWYKIGKKCRKIIRNTGFSRLFSVPTPCEESSSPPFATTWTDEVMNDAEALYAQHVHKGDHKKALATLRVPHMSYSHRNTFLLAFFLGLNVALFFTLILIVSFPPYVDSIPEFFNEFPVMRGPALVILLYWFWAAALYIWQHFRINHTVLLGFDPTKSLNWLKMCKLCSLLTFVWLFGFVTYLGSRKGLLQFVPEEQAHLVPLVTLICLMILLVLPIHGMLYWSSRKVLLTSLGALLLTPFSPVRFRDIFFADFLTSMVVPLADFQYTICFYTTGNFLSPRDNRCARVNTYAGPALAFIPFFWRALQCLKRFYETRQLFHLVNFGKYTTAICVIVFSTLYDTFHIDGFHVVWLLFVPISSLYAFAWDVVMDWGHPVFHRGRKFSFRGILRDTLLYPYRPWYFIAIVLDLLLRFAWASTISPTEAFVPIAYTKVLLAALELLRRAHWGLFRMEWEMIVQGDFALLKSPSPLGSQAVGTEELRRVVSLNQDDSELRLSEPLIPKA